MPREAPKPKHDAIRRGRKDARQERRLPVGFLVEECLPALLFYVPLTALAYRSWRRGESWVGIAILSLGSLAVLAWFVIRHLRAASERRRLQERLDDARRRRHS